MSLSVHVLALSCATPGIRGALNQWYVEVLPGLFVGSPSARVRECTVGLARRQCDAEGVGYGVSVVSGGGEQGFVLESFGQHRYVIEDFEGLQLVSRPVFPVGLFDGDVFVCDG